MKAVLKVTDEDTCALDIDNEHKKDINDIHLHLQVGEDGGCGGGGDGGCGGTGGSRAFGHLFRVSGALRCWVVVLCQHPVPGESEMIWMRKVTIFQPKKSDGNLSDGEKPPSQSARSFVR